MTVDVVDAVIREYWQGEPVPTYQCIMRYRRPTGWMGRVYGYGDTPEISFNQAFQTAEHILKNLKPRQIPAQ